MKQDEHKKTKADKNLSAEQVKEWNSIYASYRSGSLLSGTVSGVDTISVTVANEETGKSETKSISCLVVIDYRVKVLIPESQIWFNEKEVRPVHVMRSMLGAVIDYVVTDIDREGECCVASRTKALQIKRKSFLRRRSKEGARVTCNILAAGKRRLLCNCEGFDISLRASEISYARIADMRELFHSGDKKEAVIKAFNKESGELFVSIKEAEPNPFDGAEQRHPLNSRRTSVITGKYMGGVFCSLEKNLDCLCSYSQVQCDEDFHIGDTVIVAITKFDYNRKLIYGKVISRW